MIRDFNSIKVRKNFFFINSQMSIISIKMTTCKMRLIEANLKIDVKSVDIVKNEVKETKFRTKKSKNLKIIISKIFFKVIAKRKE